MKHQWNCLLDMHLFHLLRNLRKFESPDTDDQRFSRTIFQFLFACIVDDPIAAFSNILTHRAFWKQFSTEGIVLNAIMIHLWLVKCCLSGLVLTHLEAFCLYFHLGRDGGEGTPWCVGGGWHLSLVGGGTSPPNATTISTNLPPINDEQRWDFHQKYFSSTHLLDFQTHQVTIPTMTKLLIEWHKF